MLNLTLSSQLACRFSEILDYTKLLLWTVEMDKLQGQYTRAKYIVNMSYFGFSIARNVTHRIVMLHDCGFTTLDMGDDVQNSFSRSWNRFSVC